MIIASGKHSLSLCGPWLGQVAYCHLPSFYTPKHIFFTLIDIFFILDLKIRRQMNVPKYTIFHFIIFPVILTELTYHLRI